MTVEEIEKLIEDENNKRLRNPKPIVGKGVREVVKAHEVFKIVVDDMIRNPNRAQLLDLLNFKRKMRKCGILGMEVVNGLFGSYEMNTRFGKGMFLDARRLFVGCKYPRWIKYNYCHANAREYVLRADNDAKILSGIAFVGKPFLHSVVLVDDQIIDFNYDLVMSKDLYLSLTHFEVLSELTHKDMVENKQVFNSVKGLKDNVFNFAFQDIVERFNARTNKNEEGIGV